MQSHNAFNCDDDACTWKMKKKPDYGIFIAKHLSIF